DPDVLRLDLLLRRGVADASERGDRDDDQARDCDSKPEAASGALRCLAAPDLVAERLGEVGARYGSARAKLALEPPIVLVFHAFPLSLDCRFVRNTAVGRRTLTAGSSE